MTSKQREVYNNLLNALEERAKEGKLNSVRELLYFSIGYAPSMQLRDIDTIIEHFKEHYEITFDYQ